MKKMLTVVTVVLAVFIAGAAFAWDIPTKVPTSAGDVKDMAGTTALETAMNLKVEKEAANCKFVAETTQVAGCNLKKIGQEIAAVYRGAKETANYRVYINIEAADAKAAGKKAKTAANLPSGYDRADKVKADLRSGLGAVLADSWNYNTKSNQSLGDKVALSVKVEK